MCQLGSIFNCLKQRLLIACGCNSSFLNAPWKYIKISQMLTFTFAWPLLNCKGFPLGEKGFNLFMEDISVNTKLYRLYEIIPGKISLQ